jgi:lactate dehydrogenase-like 2-hydroxyacid dehydrogenase
MSLLLALVGEEPAPAVGRRFKTYSKGYLKRGHKVLVFNSQKEADEFEAAEIATAEAISRAQKKKARAEKPKPVETVNLERIEAQVVEWNIPDYLPMLVAELDIDYILSLQRRIEQMQDDEDVELLLTL